MKFKSILLISLLAFAFIGTVNASIGSVNASYVNVEKTVHKGDIISLTQDTYENDGHYPAIYINNNRVWWMADQATLIWRSGWTNDIIPDLRNAGFIDANNRFIKEGNYIKSYEWRSGFFNHNKHTTVFSFAVIA